VRNPLQVPIQLTDVQLVCTHVPVDADAAHEQEDSPRFLVEPFNHVLRAQEKQKVLRGSPSACSAFQSAQRSHTLWYVRYVCAVAVLGGAPGGGPAGD